MKTQPARLYGIIAREANRAMVLRREPAKVSQMLVWDLDTDEVIAGQWIKAEVDMDCCDLSPDGRLAVVGLSDDRRRRPLHGIKKEEAWRTENWTAICKPPYWTALALWFPSQTVGGGVWESNRSLKLDGYLEFWHEAIKPHCDLRIDELEPDRLDEKHVISARLRSRGWIDTLRRDPDRARLGWECIVDFFDPDDDSPEAMYSRDRLENPEKYLPGWETEPEFAMEKPLRRGLLRYENGYTLWSRCSLLDDSGAVRKVLKRCSLWEEPWLDVDGNGRIVFAEDGKLWAWDRFPDDEPRIVADLNGQTFEAIPTPQWAREW